MRLVSPPRRSRCTLGVRATCDDRGGYALVLVLVAMALLGTLATTAMVVALGQLRAATLSGRVQSARIGARAVLDQVLDLTAGLPQSRVGDSAVVLLNSSLGSHVDTRVVDLRLAPEFHLLLGEARTRDGIGARMGRLVWWIDPPARIATHSAVIEASAVQISAGARIDTVSVLDSRRGVAACGHLPGLAASPGSIAPAIRPLPPPPVWGAQPSLPELAPLRLGWLGPRLLDTLADHGSIVSLPPSSPGCIDCWSGLVFNEGDAVVGHEQSGVIAVLGDLTVAPGAAWSGLVLVAGNVTVAERAVVRGLIRAGGTVAVAAGAVVDGSACVALVALTQARSLHRPIPLGARSWLMPIAPLPVSWPRQGA